MSHTQLIKEMLDILYLSITVTENYLIKEKHQGQICHTYRGSLSYTPMNVSIATIKLLQILYVGELQPSAC